MSDTAPTAAKPPAGSHMMVFIGVAVTAAWLGLMFAPLFIALNDARERWLGLCFAGVSTLEAGIVTYYFGTSYGARARLAKDIENTSKPDAAP